MLARRRVKGAAVMLCINGPPRPRAWHVLAPWAWRLWKFMGGSGVMCHGLAVPLGAWDGAAQAPPALSALARMMALLPPLMTVLRAWRQWRSNFEPAAFFDLLRDPAAETCRSATPFMLCIIALLRPRACHVLAPWACRLCLYTHT